MQEVRLELLVGRCVYDTEGRKLGDIEEIIAETIDGELVVTEFHIGAGAAAERLSIRHFGSRFFALLGAHGRSPKPLKIPWQRMDLEDPRRPVVRPE
jgi:sporulation protein YlmC with PRC-barrel domain